MPIQYLSLFSGIGGLEPSNGSPILFCERDEASREVLSRAHPGVTLHDDVRTLKAPSADFILGGWPCQDLSIAGLMAGLDGAQSGLFYELCRIVKESGAHTAVMENVPGLLSNRQGSDFRAVLTALSSIGLTHIAWRTINSAEVGLPQFRERVFIVASRDKDRALAVHTSKLDRKRSKEGGHNMAVLGFYWTASARSMCFRKDAVPALKVGAPSEKGGTSPVAVFYGKTVRKLTPEEAIRIQGFDAGLVSGMQYGDVLRMAGDAVSRPVGAFVVDSAFNPKGATSEVELRHMDKDSVPDHGYWNCGTTMAIRHHRSYRHRHIWEFLDHDVTSELSPQASAGLCCRIIRAELEVPAELFSVLYEKSKTRTRLLGTKINSFDILHNQMDPMGYLEKLRSRRIVSQADFLADLE